MFSAPERLASCESSENSRDRFGDHGLCLASDEVFEPLRTQSTRRILVQHSFYDESDVSWAIVKIVHPRSVLAPAAR